ncbi:interleukin 2 receptor, gamma b isoform X2 [Erpetoichthys calabaricus]|uniref:interleukin 2 receptor, gamma b isoform X2 n=1 Tax=Erpetoichthys calabaricus TaxID=27687 RepID=UPI002234430E|nr:interleukin 2 receptor, gamma b isoform X2 [Erpetoichthys calabaricus]
MALGVILVIVAEFLQVVHTEGLAKPNISCIIYNQEYTQCMWSEHEVPQINYTFFRKYKKTMQYSECSQYIQKKEYNTGCKLEFNPDLKFSNFQVNLSSPKNSVQWDYTFQLKEKVLMNPPVNISVTSSSDNDINLTWNIPVTLKKGCLVSQVKYKNNKDVQWQTSPEIFKQTQFNLPFADESLLYEFYVKITVHSNCGGSSFWSDWSKPVYWGSNKSGGYGCCWRYKGGLQCNQSRWSVRCHTKPSPSVTSGSSTADAMRHNDSHPQREPGALGSQGVLKEIPESLKYPSIHPSIHPLSNPLNPNTGSWGSAGANPSQHRAQGRNQSRAGCQPGCPAIKIAC